MAKSTPTTFDPAEEKPAAQATVSTSEAHTTYPGQTLGVVALVLAFFLPVPALALGIVAWVWSHKAGKNNVLAKVSVFVSGAFAVIGIFLFGLWLALAGAVFGGFDRGHDDMRFGGGTVQIMPGQQGQLPGEMPGQMPGMDGDQKGGRNLPAPSDLPSATATTN